jgi:hypothetical protein
LTLLVGAIPLSSTQTQTVEVRNPSGLRIAIGEDDPQPCSYF